MLSDRFMGGHAVHIRERPIPWAYRVFFRQIGLDPDRTRTPVEALALERMKSGAFKSRNQLDDALTIATIETGVALRAFDAARIEGELGIREIRAGRGARGSPGIPAAGDAGDLRRAAALAMLFGATAEGRGVHPRTERIVLAAIQVNGVPQIAVEEALWMAATVMERERVSGAIDC